jgi:hypothetical protein
MKTKHRWLIIGGLLLATLAAGMLIDEQPPPAADVGEQAGKSAGQSARPATPARSAAAAGAQAAPLAFPAATTDEAPPPEGTIDPFRTQSWVVAPPPPPPVKPVAPPLPFQYLGKLNEGGEVRVFLSAQGKHLIARVGDVIDGVYLVEAISGARMTFVYQPLKEKQQLAIGDEK